ncbi:MAG: hypothetical protein EXR71_10445 [Myxococcales bacterium]|nr:hypothetical protein [Myxococcales bacterium]
MPTVNARGGAVLVLLGTLCGRLLLAGTLPLTEAEVVVWARARGVLNGEVPAAALLVTASTDAFGQAALGIRALGVVISGLAPLLLLRHTPDPLRFAVLLLGLPGLVWTGLLADTGPLLFAGGCAALAGALGGSWLFAGAGVAMAGLGDVAALGLWPLLWLNAPGDWRRMLPGVALSLLATGPALLGEVRDGVVDGWLAEVPLSVLYANPALVIVAAVAGRAALRRRGAEPGPAPALAGVVIGLGLMLSTANAAGYAALALGTSLPAGPVGRGAWAAAGVGLLLSAGLVAHSYRPLLLFNGDPTARLGVGADLGRAVEAWGIEPVYTSTAEDAALIAYHGGVESFVLPGPAADHALFVRPWAGGPSTAADAYCANRGGPNVVSEYNADGTPLDRWQVYELWGCNPTGRALGAR